MHARFLAISALTLTFLGAGCTQTPISSDPNNGSPTEPTAQDDRVLTAAQTDETWKTYTNARLGFSFQYPTKGKYAPQWEVKVFPESATEVWRGCYAAEGMPNDHFKRGVTKDGREFCLSHGTEGAAGSAYFNDTYSTQIGKSIAVIVFSKKALMADVGDCKKAAGQNFWSEFATPSACIPFSEEEYEKVLDGIVGTFTEK